MAGLRAVLDGFVADGAGWRGAIPDDWLQGRTAYGGLSAAIALECARRTIGDLPPLRSAQVAFVGPLSGEVTVSATLLRRGRNAAFVQADVTAAAGLGLRCTFVFVRAIAGTLAHRGAAPAPSPPPHPDDTIRRGIPAVPFTRHFEFIDRRGEGVARPLEWRRWTRLAERDAATDPAVALLAVADCLPPAAMRLARGPVPISSLTWIVNLVEPAPATSDGWWLLRAASDFVRDGSSSQVMGIWNADGVQVAEQMQSVAIFG